MSDAETKQTADRVSPIGLNAPRVGTASVVVAPPNPRRAGLHVYNPSATITLWVAPTGTPAAVNGDDSIAIQPLQDAMFGPPGMPPWTNCMNAIASSGSDNAISLLEY